jgi:PKD domain/Secretion system C-terminal sorting domain
MPSPFLIYSAMFNKTYIFFFLLFQFVATRTTQAQWHDAVWNTPYIFPCDSTAPGEYLYYADYFDFKKQSPPKDSNLVLEYTAYQVTILMSDSIGNPIFNTNGMRIWHANNQPMINGDSLLPNYLLFWPNVPWAFLSGANFTFSVPCPETAGSYYIISTEVLDQFNPMEKRDILFSRIDKATSDSTGFVAYKHKKLLESKQTTQMSLIKHANGRDWWLLVPEMILPDSAHMVNKYLITKDSVKLYSTQITNLQGKPNFHVVTPPNGEKLVFQSDQKTQTLDFNRCSGELSNLHTFFLSSPVLGFYSLPAFSPNSRFMYTGPGAELLQFDFIQSSNGILDLDTIASADTVTLLYNTGYVFNLPQLTGTEIFFAHNLAADGKIYHTGGELIKTSYVAMPNLKGKACKRVKWGMDSKYGIQGIPSHPNYRLGPLDGSACDSLGLDNKPLADFWWLADPDSLGNPLDVQFIDNSSYEPQTWSWSFNDGTGLTSMDTNAIHTFPGPGIYEVCLTVCNVNACDTVCKLVELGRTSTQWQNEVLKSSDIRVAPNPASGQVMIEYVLPTKAFDVKLYNAAGIVVGQKQLPEVHHGSIYTDVSGLLPGIYFVVLRDQLGRAYQTKLLVQR